MHGTRHTVVIRGMYGMGDCIHQRAPVRELLDAGHRIVLDTFYWSMYHDLVERGLTLRLRGGVMPRIRDRRQSNLLRDYAVLGDARHCQVRYNRDSILRHGSILAAQYASIGMRMPERPDFSLPVPTEWELSALDAFQKRPDKPIMVYRPSVLNDVWLSRARSPDPASYKVLYEAIRDSFCVVSVCHVGNKGEHIDGEEMPADVKFHRGELGFEELAGLFSLAKMALVCPGFAPVLSQAVGTPTAIVYGGNESFRTTNSAGQHLAETLAIEPINPCACHRKDHDCDKSMNLPLQVIRLREFALRTLAH